MCRFLTWFVFCFMTLCVWSDAPRPPVVIDVSMLDGTTVPTHLADQTIVFQGKKIVLNSIKKLTVIDVDETPEEVIVNVEVTGVYLSREIKGPMTVTYRPVQAHGTWRIDNVDSSKLKYAP